MIQLNKNYLENEIAQFLQGEKLNDADLQRLDAKIKKYLAKESSKSHVLNEKNFDDLLKENKKILLNTRPLSMLNSDTTYVMPVKNSSMYSSEETKINF